MEQPLARRALCSLERALHCMRLMLPAPPHSSPPLDTDPHEEPPFSSQDAYRVHHGLDVLDRASSFARQTEVLAQAMLEQLITMQTFAEDTAEGRVSAEEQEAAFKKLSGLGRDCERISSRVLSSGTHVLKGGTFSFEPIEIDEATTEHLSLELPNLQVRGEDSLRLYQYVDERVAEIGAGGRILAGQTKAPTHAYLLGQESDSAPPELAEGEYIGEITYLSPEGDDVRVRLLSEDGETVIAEITDVDLSALGSDPEIDLGLGLSLTIARLRRRQSVETNSSTRQVIKIVRDQGDRLASAEGSFSRAVQPRDFELFALYLEEPVETVREAVEQIAHFQTLLATTLENLLGRLEAGAFPPDADLSALARGAAAWSAIDERGLIHALREDF